MLNTIEPQIRFSKGTKRELAATLAWLERQGYKRAATAIMTRLCISPEERVEWQRLKVATDAAPSSEEEAA